MASAESAELVVRGQAVASSEKDELQLDRSSLIIGIMGLTGSGKSTLISLLTGQKVKIGHDLKACTSEVSVYCGTWRYKTVFFVDTPGFDDTFRSNSDVLKDIAFWLSRAYTEDLKLAGMIYLHRITDDRMGGSALTNLHMFEKLCGPNSLKSVVLATTTWDLLKKQDPTMEDGELRENQLKEDPNFWRFMVKNGSKVVRHDGSKESAWDMVSYILEKQEPVILDIQKQLVDNEQSLENTPAGRLLEQELHEQREKYERELSDVKESMEATAKMKDTELNEQLTKQKDDFEAKIRNTYDQQHKLKVDMQAMFDEQNRRQEEKLRAMKAERDRQEEDLRKREQEISAIRRNMRDMTLQLDRRDRDHQQTVEDLREIQRSQTEKDEQYRRREQERDDALEERLRDQMILDHERQRQADSQRKLQDEAANLRRLNAQISIVRVIGGLGLAGFGAATANPALAAAGVGVARGV